jgi:hypothetical protein
VVAFLQLSDHYEIDLPDDCAGEMALQVEGLLLARVQSMCFTARSFAGPGQQPNRHPPLLQAYMNMEL